MEKSKLLLAYLSLKFNGDWFKTYEAVKKKDEISEEELRECEQKLENVNVLTILDAEYPECLREAVRPPFVLFYKGDISLLGNKEKNITFYGKREMDSDSTNVVRAIESITDECKDKDYVFVSGGSKGTLTRMINVSLEKGIKNIVVLAGSFDKPYPAENEKLFDKVVENGGLVITEYPFDVIPERDHFPERMRIMAGVSAKTVILSASKMSGAMVGVQMALRHNQDIYCVPTKLFDNEDGCNGLIVDGAIPLVLANQLTI